MACSSKGTVLEVAVRTLIKEIIATFEARRRARRRQSQCDTCRARTQEATA
jgi:hypothetical protein